MQQSPQETTEVRSSNARARGALLAILILGIGGTLGELLLQGHYEEAGQWIPLGLLALALCALAWLRLRPGGGALRALRLTMLLVVLSGFAGAALHFHGGSEFQRESGPALGGLRLFWKVVRAHAPPALAPGAMVLLGLLGLVYASLLPAGAGTRTRHP